MPKRAISGFGVGMWLLLAGICALLAVAVQQVTRLQAEQLRNAAREGAQNELQLIRSLVGDVLQQQNYQEIDPILQQWGRSHRQIREIRLVAANDFVIGHYRREGPAGEMLRLSETLPHAYQGHATLELSVDLSYLGERIEQLRVRLGAAAVGAAVVAWLLLWTNRLRRRQALMLRLRSGELQQAEERLKQATEELERERRYLRHSLDSIPSILVGVDAEGRITHWNQGAEAATHIETEDALGLPFTELLPQLREESILQAIAEQRRHTQRISRVSAGMVRYYNVVVAPLPAAAGNGAFIRVEDISRQVRFEQMMVQSEKMTALGGLAAGVAHEINSPLSGVLQNCQNVLRRLSADLPANRRTADSVGIDLERLQEYLGQRKIPKFLDMVRDAAERASRIINDLRAFSRRNVEGFEKVAVNELLESSLRLAASDYEMKKRAEYHQVEVTRDFAADLPLLHCERTRIEQVLLNLIRNAAQAMALANTPAPRRITVRARREDEQALLLVEDNGPGMDEETRRRALEPFFTTSAPGAGAGLGLSVVDFIVTQQHGGSVELDSAPGRGTRIGIRLPFVPDPSGEASGATSGSTHGS